MPFFEKTLTSPGVVEVGGRHIKRYHVVADDLVIEPEVEAAAAAFLPRLLPELDETPPAGFAVLHRSSSATYLNAYAWVWGNVIECHIAAAGEPVLGCPDLDPAHFIVSPKPWIGCVWELPAIEHERSAWVRHVLAPEEPDLDGYLADLLPGVMVGGPRLTISTS